MKSNPRLIPRLNVEFSLRDLDNALEGGDDEGESARAEVAKVWHEGQPIFVETGRTALLLALQALGLERGSKVAVPLYTCEAVFEAVARAGGTPVFVDSDPQTMTMDPLDLARKAGGIRAVVPNHTFGHPADIEALASAARGAPIIEDCAHSVGSEYRGRPTGALGTASFFSFRLGKPLSAGSVGMLLCNDDAVFERAVALAKSIPQFSDLQARREAVKDACRAALYHRPWFGSFSLPLGSILDRRMDLMEKVRFAPHLAPPGMLRVLAERLRELPERLSRTRANALRYANALRGTRIPPPVEARWARHAFYQFAMRLPDTEARDRTATHLDRFDVDSIKFYREVPPIAARYGYAGDCTSSESLSDTVLTVPCHSQLTDAEATRIAEALGTLGEAS